jgi:hypothetical protein
MIILHFFSVSDLFSQKADTADVLEFLRWSINTSIGEPSSPINLLQHLNSDLNKDLSTNYFNIVKSEIKFWGWSPTTGSVAISEFYYTEYRGGHIFKAFIYNFLETTTLWHRYIDSFDFGDMENYKNEKDYNNLYSSLIKDFASQCSNREYSIEFGKKAEYMNLPIRNKGKTYNIKVDIVAKTETESDGWWDKIKSYSVVIETEEKKKVIYTKNFVETNIVKPCGYFISPDGKIALIVLAEFMLGLEGDCYVNYVFTGCNLSLGFD